MRKPPLRDTMVTIQKWHTPYPCRPKRLLPCRAFVTDLCGVNVPWRYNEKSSFWTSKLDQIGTYFKGEVWVRYTWTRHTYMFCYVLLCLSCVGVNLYQSISSIYGQKQSCLCSEGKLQSSGFFIVLRRFRNDFIVWDIYAQGSWTSVLDWEGIAKKLLIQADRLNKKMRLLYNGNGNQTCIIPRLPEALPILFKRSGFKGILHR